MRHALETGCLISGILCLFYYTGIVLYAGITTSFAWSWLCGGAALIVLRIVLWYQKQHPHLWLRCLTGAASVLIMVAFVVILVVGSRIVGAMHTVPQENLNYVIVLGAQVRGTSPSLSLKKRLERAAEYAEENPGTIFILSGGQGPDEGISEAECMYQYLVAAGVPEDRLIKEDASTSTRENLTFSAEIIRGLAADKEQSMPDMAADKEQSMPDMAEDEEQSVPDTDADVGISVAILSNNFHIYRALLLAEQIGFTNASGIPADSVWFMQPHNILREICAVLVMRFSH
ncbi:MAG: YdcF family protein [Clostridiales bacterium]|nr:YdcF family protein [Clostridiales bacterium]